MKLLPIVRDIKFKKRRQAQIFQFPPNSASRNSVEGRPCLDSYWQRTLDARRELEDEASGSCHRGPGDPDWRR